MSDEKESKIRLNGHGTVNDQLKEVISRKPIKAVLTCEDGETIPVINI